MEVVKGETKRCSKCKEVKPVGEFYRNRNMRDGRLSDCGACRLKTRQAKYYPQERAQQLSSKYGMTVADYERMFYGQGGKCAICRKTPEEAGGPNRVNGKLDIDHCHKTGTVRKLLCWNCNSSLGKFEDSVPRLKAAIAYLEEHQTKNDNDNSLA